MKSNLVTALFALLILSCNGKYEYWDISEFNLQETALKNREEIKLLYTSNAPDKNKDREYYIHLVAVSLETGDTINILTTVNNGIGEKDKNKAFIFPDENSLEGKIILSDTDNIEEFDFEKESKTEAKKINKVARDPNFDAIAENKYPTVIGIIAEDVTKE